LELITTDYTESHRGNLVTNTLDSCFFCLSSCFLFPLFGNNYKNWQFYDINNELDAEFSNDHFFTDAFGNAGGLSFVRTANQWAYQSN
jgi:hypothetical protein